MKRSFRVALMLALATSIAMPAFADDDDRRRDRRHDDDRREYRDRDDRRGDRRDRRERRGWRDGCPPGLVRADNRCIPPGLLRRSGRDDRDHRDYRDYRPRRGDVLRRSSIDLLRDPDRYKLQRRDSWRYYRDGNRIYRVDRDTRRILEIMEIVDSFGR